MSQAFQRGRLIRAEAERQVRSVSEVNAMVRGLVERGLGRLWVSGEASTVRPPLASGHLFFTLKDDRAQLRAVMYREAASRLCFRLEEGLQVTAYGKLTVYEARGEYQMVVEALEPVGLGAQELALRQLRERLFREGLFDPRRKRALPRFPACIAIITSGRGAAVKDMLEVIARRWPRMWVLVRPVRVQGAEAPREIAAAIEDVNAHGAADVILVGRGGGSRDDLNAFNHEPVARAIARSRAPVISCVGHAIDVSVADLVADLHAITPSEAAERATQVLDDVLAHLDGLRERLQKAAMRPVEGARARLDLLRRSYALRAPEERLRQLRERLDALGPKLERESGRLCERARDRTGRLAQRLEALSPLAVLARGYSATFPEPDQPAAEALAPLTDASAVAPGQRLRTRLARGEIISRVEVILLAAGLEPQR